MLVLKVCAITVWLICQLFKAVLFDCLSALTVLEIRHRALVFQASAVPLELYLNKSGLSASELFIQHYWLSTNAVPNSMWIPGVALEDKQYTVQRDRFEALAVSQS